MIEITEEDLANARFQLATAIIDAPNAGEILSSIHNLTSMYAQRARQEKKSKNKKKELKWKTASDEFYTIMMCAVYNKQDLMEEE